MVKMGKTELLLVLIGVTLLISIINLYGIAKVSSNLATGVVVANQPSEDGAEIPSAAAARFDANDPVKGDENAPVTIIEFSDFQCPYCARFYQETMPLIEKNYVETGKVRLVFRQFPLGFHQYAQKAAEASLCANEQGRFWEYHNKLFDNQDALDDASLKQYAKELGLDTSKFNSCLDSGKMASEVSKDSSEGQSYGVSGTPDFFVNGVQLTGAQPYEAFKSAIEQQLAKT